MSRQQLLRRDSFSVLPRRRSSGLLLLEPVVPTKESHEKGNRCDLDPNAYKCLKENSFKENLKALNSTHFKKACCPSDTYLDVGCGPGGFLQEHLLPCVRPCKHVVGVDVCPLMLYSATKECKEPEVSFELLDIECGDPAPILETYGKFDRLYSFLTFHYVSDLKKAYRNVSQVLKDGGEGLIVYFVRTDITDMLQRLYDMNKWNLYMPDLRERFAKRFCFNTPVPEDKIAAEEESALRGAGFEIVSCRFHTSEWTFPSLEECVDLYISFFKVDADIPTEKWDLFRNDCRDLLAETSRTAEGGCILKHSAVVVHFRKLASAEE